MSRATARVTASKACQTLRNFGHAGKKIFHSGHTALDFFVVKEVLVKGEWQMAVRRYSVCCRLMPNLNSRRPASKMNEAQQMRWVCLQIG